MRWRNIDYAKSYIFENFSNQNVIEYMVMQGSVFIVIQASCSELFCVPGGDVPGEVV
jgi:hypothetical protein